MPEGRVAQPEYAVLLNEDALTPQRKPNTSWNTLKSK